MTIILLGPGVTEEDIAKSITAKIYSTKCPCSYMKPLILGLAVKRLTSNVKYAKVYKVITTNKYALLRVVISAPAIIDRDINK